MRMRLLIISMLLCLISLPVVAAKQCKEQGALCTASLDVFSSTATWIEISGFRDVTLRPNQIEDVMLNGLCFASDGQGDQVINVSSDTGIYQGNDFDIGPSGKFTLYVSYDGVSSSLVPPEQWVSTGHYNAHGCTDAEPIQRR